MKHVLWSAAVALVLAACQSTPTPQAEEERDCWQGLSSDGSTLDKTFVTAGRKAQIIGQQDLRFADMGGHIPGEMGGIWMGRIKVADGFWLNVTDANGQTDSIRAQRMTVYPHYNTFDCGQIASGVAVACQQFASDSEGGVAIIYTLTNNTKQAQQLQLEFLLNSDLSPAWYSRKDEVRENAPDDFQWNAAEKCFEGKDQEHDWFSVLGTDQETTSQLTGVNGVPTQGPVHTVALNSALTLEAGATQQVTYYVAGSSVSAEMAKKSYQTIKANLAQELEKKAADIKKLLANSSIDIPEKDIQRAYDWTVINNRWLEQDIEEIGYFLGAGAVEYPWLFGCDMSYSLQGQLRIGNFDLVKSTLIQLWKTSEQVNGNGRIIHERSNYGLTYNPGNTQETAHFIMALWDYYQWTGDKKLVELIYPYCKKGIEWLTDTMDQNGNLFPSGPGIMEVSGLTAELIDVAVYTQQALECMAKMSVVAGDPTATQDYAQKASWMVDEINDEFWDTDRVSYCDFHASAADAIKAMEGAIRQVKLQTDKPMQHAFDFYENQMKDIRANYPMNKEKGWFSNINWVVAVPMECGIVEPARAVSALEQIEENNYGPYGPYLSAVERDRSMTIATGVQAVAEARYGRIDKAVENLKQMTKCFGLVMPGAITEMLPDYGCTFQAWTIYGYAKTLISGCFGIEPDATNKVINLKPQLPMAWQDMHVKQVRIGDNAIDLDVVHEGHAVKVIYHSQKPGWKVVLTYEDETHEITTQDAEIILGK